MEQHRIETLIKMLKTESTRDLGVELLKDLEDIDLYYRELVEMFIPLGPGSLRAYYKDKNDFEMAAKIDVVRYRMQGVGAIKPNQYLFGR